MKRSIFYNCGKFLQNRTTITPPSRRSNLHPSLAVLSIGPGTCRSSGGYSVESRRVYLTFKNSPERNSRGLLILLWRVLYQGSHLLQILLKALRPRNVWLVKCWIYHVRNFKCILLTGLLLHLLTSRQHFYNGKYLREIPEIWGYQRLRVSWCNKLKKS